MRISEWALEAEAGLWQEELGKTEVYLSQKGDGKEGTQQDKIPNTPGEDVSDPFSLPCKNFSLPNTRIKKCSAK